LHLVPWKNRRADIIKPLWKDWTNAQTCTADSVQTALVEYPQADWAIVPKGFVVLDLDVKNGKDGISLIKQWCIDNGSTFDEFTNGCAIIRTFSKGMHVWFKYQGSLTSSDVANGIEAKHINESVHIPPSEGYSWEKEFVTIEELPQIPQWFVDKWEASCARKKEEKLYTQEKVSVGNRHDFLVSFGAKLRDMGMSIPEIKSSLRAVAKERFEVSMSVSEIDSVADSFKNYDATDLHALALSGDWVANVLINFEKEVIEVVEEDTVEEPIRDLSSDITEPNEIIAKWCAAVDYNCPMNQPIYCLGSAIAGIGTIMGRRYQFNGCYANNYVLLLGATSTGKQAPLSVTKKILRELDLAHLIGSSEFASGQGIAEEIANKNELIWMMDELSFLLRGLAHPNAPGYILSISKMLLQLYSGGSNEGTARADGTTRIIEKPYPNILSAAQPSTFIECITRTFIESGFLGRFLCLTGKDDFRGKPFGQFKGNDKDPVITSNLVDILKPNVSSWQTQIAISTGSSKLSEAQDIKSDDGVYSLVQKYFDSLADRRSVLVKKNLSGISDVLSKNREKLIKLMMIHAFTSNPSNPLITKDSVSWAKKVLKIADSTIESSVLRMSENTQEKDVNKIYEFISRHGEKGVTANDLTASIRSIKKRDRDCIIEDLIAGNKITFVKDTSKPGRPKTTFYLKKFAPKKD